MSANTKAPLSLFERLDALRELLGEGSLLLAEVSTLVRNAEEGLRHTEQIRVELQALRLEKESLQTSTERLQEENTRLRCERAASPPENEKSPALLAEISSLQEALRQCRQSLETERARRNRAISLIRPLGDEQPAPSPSP